jgi:hypothetical protein
MVLTRRFVNQTLYAPSLPLIAGRYTTVYSNITTGKTIYGSLLLVYRLRRTWPSQITTTKVSISPASFRTLPNAHMFTGQIIYPSVGVVAPAKGQIVTNRCVIRVGWTAFQNNQKSQKNRVNAVRIPVFDRVLYILDKIFIRELESSPQRSNGQSASFLRPRLQIPCRLSLWFGHCPIP